MQPLARAKPIGRGRMRGLSLVELMIGIAVGLFIVAAATTMAVTHLDGNRRLMLETQVQQDMRAAMDVITRDLRRAGYSGAAASGVWTKANVNPENNAYDDLTEVDGPPLVADVPKPSIQFAYSSDADNVVSADEQAGFRLMGNAIEMQIGAFQQLTDPTTLTVTALTFTLHVQTIDLGVDCVAAPPVGASARPTQRVRSIDVAIQGQAANDSAVTRSLRSTVRLPNDVITGACLPPAP